MKVVYLFTGYRGAHLAEVRARKEQGNGYWGMLRLHKFGVTAEYLELEQTYLMSIARFLRRHILSVYFVHLPLYFRFFKYDIVFTSTGYGTQLVHTLLQMRKPRWVMHDFSIMGLLGKEKTLFQKVFAWMVSRCAGIVTVAKAERDALQKRFPKLHGHIVYIPYGVDLEYFRPTGIPEEREIFVPGRDPDRDYKTLFEAAKGLDAKVIVTTHKSRLDMFQPLPSFVIHKTLSVEELRESYAKASVVVLPLDITSGLNDAMGVSALYEALAMGKAIIATRTPTMESYIESGENGILVDEGNIEGMRQALSNVLSDTQLRTRLGKNARAYAEKNLDADVCTKNLADFFERIQ